VRISYKAKIHYYLCGEIVRDKYLKNRVNYINEAKAKFDSYGNGWIKYGFPRLRISGFDAQTGGFVVYHEKHQFDPTRGVFKIRRGDYEKYASKVLMKYGMMVELGSETPGDIKKPDGLLNGKIFDIKGVEGTGKGNILNDIKNASKKGAEVIVLYYHKNHLFDEKQIHESYQKYMRTSKSKRIQHVYYIVDRKLYTLK